MKDKCFVFSDNSKSIHEKFRDGPVNGNETNKKQLVTSALDLVNYGVRVQG